MMEALRAPIPPSLRKWVNTRSKGEGCGDACVSTKLKYQPPPRKAIAHSVGKQAITMEHPIEINSTRIAAHFVTCAPCGMIWRTTNATRCPRCAQAYGLPFQLDDLRASQLMDAMANFGNEEEYKDHDGDDIMRLALAMEDPLSERQRILARFQRAMDHCQWFNYEDPWYTQTCWMVLREHHFDHPMPHLQRAMEILEAQFQERVVLVDERGNLVDQDPLMG